jgi:hypothetical protein
MLSAVSETRAAPADKLTNLLYIHTLSPLYDLFACVTYYCEDHTFFSKCLRAFGRGDLLEQRGTWHLVNTVITLLSFNGKFIHGALPGYKSRIRALFTFQGVNLISGFYTKPVVKLSRLSDQKCHLTSWWDKETAQDENGI